MNPQEILRQARAALQQGADPAAVDRRIAEATGGRFAGVAALEAGAGNVPAGLLSGGTPGHEEVALARLNARGGSAAGDFLRMMAQGATFGFADELAGVGAAVVPGGRGYSEARDASRQRVEDLRQLNPGASMLSEIAGGVALPAAAFARGGGVAAARAGSLAGTAGRAAAAGAAGGAAYGMGEAEGGPLERVPEALTGGLLGAATGGALGAAGGVIGKARQALRRVPEPPAVADIAADLARRVGVPDGEISALQELARATTRRVSRESYGPLEEAFPTVDDELILSLLRGTRGGSENASAFAWAARQVMGREVQKRAPSFRELQSIERRLRGRANKARTAGDPAEAQVFGQAAGELRAAMEQRLPGFAEAQAAYRTAKAAENAFEAGTKAWGGGSKRNRPEQIRAALAALPDDAARDNFRAGMAAVFHDELARKSGRVTRAQIERLQSAGWSGRIRELFRSAWEFNAFMAELERAGEVILSAEQREAAREALRKLAQYGGIGAAGFGAGSLLDLF